MNITYKTHVLRFSGILSRTRSHMSRSTSTIPSWPTAPSSASQVSGSSSAPPLTPFSSRTTLPQGSTTRLRP